MAKILSGDCEQSLDHAAQLLCRGGIVALPTETVYGLAADATNSSAVAQIFEIKGRPLIDPLIVHVLNCEHASTIAHITDTAIKLTEIFWPGPLTLVLPKKPAIPHLVTAGKDSVALRSPSHPVMRRVIEITGLPLAAPSANPFGYISPTTADHVQDSLGSKLQFIVNGGPCEYGLESTILSLLDPQKPSLLRPGPISKVELENALCQTIVLPIPIQKDTAQEAPGMLLRHYSPHTSLQLSPHPHVSHTTKNKNKTALLYLTKPSDAILAEQENTSVFWCSETPDLHQSARHLFALLRLIDMMQFNIIIAELAPEKGIGIAINDRLKRAAQPKA